jgi:hypothetical protein
VCGDKVQNLKLEAIEKARVGNVFFCFQCEWLSNPNAIFVATYNMFVVLKIEENKFAQLKFCYLVIMCMTRLPLVVYRLLLNALHVYRVITVYSLVEAIKSLVVTS